MDKTKVTGNLGLESLERVLKPLSQTETLYRAFDLAEKVVTNYIGTPICMENCGKCCEVTTPDVWEVEAQFLISYITGSGGAKLQDIVIACEEWLTERNPSLKTYGLPALQLTEEQWTKVRPELNLLLENSPCPFLLQDKKCLIHFARPLACRCYGVTRMASRICPRPTGKNETPDIRAHIAPTSDLGVKIRSMLISTLKSADKIDWAWTYFLPTILYKNLCPDKFDSLICDGRIPTAKLLKLRTNTSILFQDQLNEIWNQERIPSLEGGTSCQTN